MAAVRSSELLLFRVRTAFRRPIQPQLARPRGQRGYASAPGGAGRSSDMPWYGLFLRGRSRCHGNGACARCLCHFLDPSRWCCLGSLRHSHDILGTLIRMLRLLASIGVTVSGCIYLWPSKSSSKPTKSHPGSHESKQPLPLHDEPKPEPSTPSGSSKKTSRPKVETDSPLTDNASSKDGSSAAPTGAQDTKSHQEMNSSTESVSGHVPF